MGCNGERISWAWRALRLLGPVYGPVQAAGLDDDTVIAGHSMGGAISLRAAVAHGDRFSHLIMLDSPLRPESDAQEESGKARSPFQNKRFYPDFETAVSRFRLLPEQPAVNPWLVEYIANHSLHETAEGWCWKFDDNAFKTRMFGRGGDLVEELKIPLAVVYGEQSKFFDVETLTYMRQLLPADVPFIAVPEAHHHLFLDQPLAFVTAMRSLLNTWAKA